MTPKKDDTIVVWVSCGAASAVAAKMTVEKYGDLCRILLVNNPVAEEHPDNQRFLDDMSAWIGLPVIRQINPDWPSCSARDVWEKRKFMSGVAKNQKGFAPCTDELKKMSRRKFEETNRVDWHVLGFTADTHEKKRYERFVLGERQNTLPILIEAGITKDMCFDIIRTAGLKLPEIYLLGYPNANCIGCVKATSPTYWNLVRKTHPDVFADRAEQSRRLGAKLVRVKNKRIFLDELDPSAKGRSLKSMPSVECGIFCEEWP